MMFAALPPRFGGEWFLLQTEQVPAPSIEGWVFISTVNNALGCETAIFLAPAPGCCLISTDNDVIWRVGHGPWQDLTAEHERIVTAVRDGSLDLWPALKQKEADI